MVIVTVVISVNLECRVLDGNVFTRYGVPSHDKVSLKVHSFLSNNDITSPTQFEERFWNSTLCRTVFNPKSQNRLIL